MRRFAYGFLVVCSLGLSACGGAETASSEADPQVPAAPGVAATPEASAATDAVLRGDAVVCDENGRRYVDEAAATEAGLALADFGATYCPEYKMDPSWDVDGDGINDCYRNNACKAGVDYMSPRPL